LHFPLRAPGALAALILATTCPAGWASNPAERTLVYRLRGEVRPFLFWIGRDDVGGGRITIRQTYSSPARWREEIEVLFGSEPERIPGRINRWGYGWESAEWVRDHDAATPRLLATEFQGVMRHSAESSIGEVVPEAGRGGTARAYDVTRSAVLPERARHELWIFTDEEEFRYRRPARLLAKYRVCVATGRARHGEELSNRARAYAEPYGFLTALSRLTAQVVNAYGTSPQALRRARPSLTFVFNAKPYLLEVTGVRRVTSFRARYGALPPVDVAVMEFRSLNTVRRTRTDFELWTPLAGDLKGMPVRIVLQPRWWLRLQLDLDAGAQAGSERQ
jgi:hypothetical protein